MSRWTAKQMPDLAGRSAVVTGANSGLGLETARELARAGARVTLAVRDEAKGEAAAADIRRSAAASAVDVHALDLADLASVRRFAAEWRGPLDLLVNNAGVMAIPRLFTAEGYELQFGTNHLGHFALTGLLLPALLAAPSARVVTLSSILHRRGRLDFEDLQGERSYDRNRAYAQAKLANLMFALELDRRARAAGAALLSVAAHPGYSATNLQGVGPRMEGSRVRELGARIANAVIAQSAAQGALPTLYCAVADVEGGVFVGSGGPFELRGYPKIVKPAQQADDREAAARLWAVSEQLTGVGYDFRAPTAAPG